MNREFWTNHYKENKILEPSSFAEKVMPLIPLIDGDLVDIGCGDGRDLHYFMKNGIVAHGVDGSAEGLGIKTQDINDYMKENKAPDNVYARFFWHAITYEEQLRILAWTEKYLYIEARTSEDFPTNVIGKHDRNLVGVEQLIEDLLHFSYKIHYLKQGTGMSIYKNEDPHLVRVIAEKIS